MLLVGNFVSTAVGAVAVILIARLLGPEQYGEYTLAFVVPGVLQLFVGLGVNSSVIRFSAYSISTGKLDDAKRYTLNGLYFLVVLSTIITIVSIMIAGPVSSALLNRPALSYYVQLASLYVFGFTLLQSVSSAAIGWKWMELASISQVVQAVLRLFAAPILIIAGFGTYGAITGQVTSLIIAGLVATLFFYGAKLRGRLGKPGRFASDIREMVSYGFPIFVGGIISGLAIYYVAILMASITSNAVIGFYQAAVNVTYPVALISTSASYALFPAFASLDGIGVNAQAALKQAIKYVAFLMTPVAVFLIVASGQIVPLLYGERFAGSVPLLVLLAFTYLPVALGYAVIPIFFNGFGRPKLSMLSYLIGGIVLALTAPLLSITLGLEVDGLIYSLFLSYLAVVMIGAYLAKTRTNASLGLKPLVSILFASAVAGVIGSLTPLAISSHIFSLAFEVILFSGVYLTLVPLTGGLTLPDISVFRMTLAGIGLVGGLVAPILKYEEIVLGLIE